LAKEDAMTKDIRKNLTAAFMRVPKYTSSIAKLFLASTKSVINTDMPVIGAMYETNQDLLKDVVKTLRNPADAINKQVNRVLNTEAYSELQRLKRYVISDLKTGELYKKGRARSINGDDDDPFSSFGGVDMDGFDENGDWSDDEAGNSAEIDAEVHIAEVQEENADTRTSAVIGAIGSATEATAYAIDSNSQLSIRTAIKMHSQQMNAFQNMITTQAATFEAINTNITAQLEVTREAHNQVMGKMDEITNILTSIKNSVVPKPEDKSRTKPRSVFGSYGELNIRSYLEEVIEQANDKFQIKNSVINMTGGVALKDFIQMLMDNPLKEVTDMIVKSFIKPELREHMKNTGEGLASIFPAFLQHLYTIGQKFERGDGDETKSLLGALAGIFGISQSSKSSIDIRQNDILAAAQFTKKTARAIEEVIPMWISKVYSAITGLPLQIYNYTTGELERVRDVVATNTRSAQDLYDRMGTTRYEINRRIRYFNFKNSDDEEDFKDFVYRYMQNKIEGNEFINPNMSFKEFKDDFDNAGYDLRNSHSAEQYYALFTGILKSLPDKVRLGMARDMAKARERRNTNNAYLNEDLLKSGLSAAYSGFEDQDIVYDIGREAMKHASGLSATDIDKRIKKTLDNQPIEKVGPAATNYILRDVLSTLRKGIITYSYQMGDVGERSSDILDEVRSAAVSQYDLDRRVKRAAYDEQNRKIEQRKYEEKRHDERALEAKANPKDIVVTKNMDPNIAETIQRMADADRSSEGQSGNMKTEQYRKLFDSGRQQATAALDDISDSLGISTLKEKINKIIQVPLQKFDEALAMADRIMLKMVFGEDTELETTDRDGSHMFGFISKVVESHFSNAFGWFKREIAMPAHDMLFDKSEGLFPKMIKSAGELLGFKDGKNPVVDKVKEKATAAKDYIIGKKVETTDEEGNVTSRSYEGGKLSNAVNAVSAKVNETKDEAKTSIIGAIKSLLFGKEGKSTYMDLDEDGNIVQGTAYGGIAGSIQKGFSSFKELMFGDKYEDTDSKQKWRFVTGELHDAFPDMVLGGGVGVLASLFLPGGPILGALLGSTAGLIKGSDRLNEFLFGKTSEEYVLDKDGRRIIDPKTGEFKTKNIRLKGGLIDPVISEGFKKFFPAVAGGSAIGAALGGMGLLPFGLGSAAGAVIGGVTGMLARSDQVKELIFGKYGDDDSGLISKNDRAKIVEAVKKYAPPTLGLGLAGGALGGLLGMGLGLIPGLALLPTGPIFAIMGSLMGFANAESINKFFFGEEVEQETEVDDGNGGKKKEKKKHREGGLFGGMYDYVKDHIVTPFGNKINETGYKIQGWFQESIVGPLKNSMAPFKEQMKKAGSEIFNSLKNIGDRITESIFKVFDISLNGDDGEGGLKAWFHDKVLRRLNNLANKIFDTIGRILGKIIAAPFKAFEFIVTGGKSGGDGLSDDIDDSGKPKKKTLRDKFRDIMREHQLRKAKRAAERAIAHGSDIFDRLDDTQGKPADDKSGVSGYYKDYYQYSPRYKQDEDKKKSDAAGDIADPTKLKEQAERAVYEANRNNWNDINGRSNSNFSNSGKDYTQGNRPTNADGTPIPDAPPADKPKEPEQAKGEKETRERVTRRSRFNKSNNEYLKEIAKYTHSIFDEVKGQVNGVGWNTAYIRAVLDKHFEPLSPEELPEEMEGSKKTIKKRRGLLGRAKDKAVAIAGAAKDKLVAIVGPVVHFLTAPFRFLAAMALKAKDALGALVGGLIDGAKLLGSFLVEALKTAGAMVKEVAIGAAQGVGSVLAGAGRLIYHAAGGLGEALGNIAGTITGVLHDMTLALSSAVLGLFETAAAIAPDIALGAWKGAKWLLKKGFALAGLAGKGIGGGIKWVFKKITGKGKKNQEAAKEKPDKAEAGTGIKLSGGFLDSLGEIKDLVPVAVGGDAHVPFPVIKIARGKPVGAMSIKYAIPVYVLGNHDPKSRRSRGRSSSDDDDESVNEPAGNGGNGDEYGNTSAGNDIGNFVNSYNSIDREAEQSDNSETYDRAIANARTKEEVDAIVTAHQLNLGDRLVKFLKGDGKGEKKEKGEGLLSKLFDAFTGGGGGKGLVRRALGAIAPIAAAVAAAGFHFTSEKGNKLWGAQLAANAATTVAKKAADPKSILGKLAHSGKGLVSNIDDFITLVRNPTAADSMIAFGEKNSTKLKGYAAAGLNKLGTKVGGLIDVGKAGASQFGRAVAGSADDLAELGPVRKAIAKVLSAIANNGTIKKMFGTMSKKLGPMIKKLTSFISDKVLKHAVKSGGKSAIKSGFRQISTFVSGGGLGVVFAVADFISGFGNAKKYFNVFGSDVTLGMRLTSGIVNTIGGLLGLIPHIGPLLTVAAALYQDQIVQLVYSQLADGAAQEELAEDQAKLENATAQYNAENGTELTVDEYAKQFNDDGSKHHSIGDFFTKTIPYAAGYASHKFVDFFAGMGKTIADTLIGAKDKVVEVAGTVADKLRSAGEHIKSFVTDIPGKTVEFVSNLWDHIKHGAVAIKDTVVGFIKSIPDKIGKFFGGIWTGIKSLWGGVKNAFSDIGESAYQGWQDAGKGPGDHQPASPSGSMLDIGRGIADRFISAVSETYNERKSGPELFRLIGEGIGGSLLNDLRETSGKNANFGTVMTNAVGISMGASSKSVPWYKKAANAVSNFFGWGKGKHDNTEDDLNMEWGTGVKPMRQGDAKWNRSDSKMALTGCGPTAAAIVASKYDKSANPAEANAESKRMGMRAPDGGTNPEFFGQYAANHGYQMRQGPVDPGAISNSLQKNQPVVVMGKGGAFGNNMHYMVADRSNNNGTVGLIDPITGGRKSSQMNSLLSKTANAIYSYGKGPGESTSTSEAQQELVGKMAWLAQNPIKYDLEGPQDPDKGSASCASTVGWAYRKVFGNDLNGMSASSKKQARDSRFTTIWGNPADEGKQPGKLLNLSMLQPGDIVYMKNPSSNHTEMYAGNGMDWSHGGPGLGPVLRTLDETRQKRVWAVNRYTPFLNGQQVSVTQGDTTTTSTSTSVENTEGSTTASEDTSGIASLFTPDAGDKFTAGGLLNAFLGIGNVIGAGISNVLNALLGNQSEGTEDSSAGNYSSANVGITANTKAASKVAGVLARSNLSKNENTNMIWKFLHDQGLTDAAAAGYMGCWQEESYNTPNRIEGDYLKQFPGADVVMKDDKSLNDYTKNILFPALAKSDIAVNQSAYLGGNGNYYPGLGLAQWTGPRAYKLMQFAAEQGKDWRELKTQLEFFATEMNSRGLKDIVNSAVDPAEAAHKVLDNYEMRPGFGESHPDWLEKRQRHANAYYNLYSNQGDTPTDDATTDVNLYNKKNRLNEAKVDWGTGPSPTLEALNEKIRQMNSMFTAARGEAAEDASIATMTNKITEAISNVTAAPASSDGEKMMQIMVQSLATMVELLKAIKDNTDKKNDPPEPKDQNPIQKLPVTQVDPFADDVGVGTNERDIGADIIDILTSK